ncbi:MAG: MmcQ/YjbR family DNA-binding protein [Tannerella sp.]|jgi:predicted DNA-binding protein (MmcQ/YjbR family)|nr:MmcQ/YjbR family DNA-binding protein [Tannerella sp.]
MNIEELRELCMNVKGAEECMPFDEDTMVYKVMGKMFAYFPLTPKNGDFCVNMKCDPEKTLELRDRYNGIVKAIHVGDSLMWNTIYIQSDVPDKLIKDLITHSVSEVIKKLPKIRQKEYREL